MEEERRGRSWVGEESRKETCTHRTVLTQAFVTFRLLVSRSSCYFSPRHGFFGAFQPDVSDIPDPSEQNHSGEVNTRGNTILS